MGLYDGMMSWKRWLQPQHSTCNHPLGRRVTGSSFSSPSSLLCFLGVGVKAVLGDYRRHVCRGIPIRPPQVIILMVKILHDLV